MPTFRLEEDSLQHRFLQSKAKVQLYGGGFANGKTATSCIKALQLAKDYPGSNGLMARSTYPKLNDTLRKEFLKWCPQDWIKSFPRSQNASNTCTLNNGTMINFRYISQQGKSTGEATTSNLLSATYDWIVVDQMEDHEIVQKDFLDLLGRLRGKAKYVGNDPDMPESGPRWFVITTNPTRNWLFRKLVKPLKDFERGIYNEDLLCETNANNKPLVIDGKPKPIIELFEGSTYENKGNLEPDFIKTLEAAYTGQMRTRFLMGEWSAYEGLVYPQFDELVHVMNHDQIERYYWNLVRRAKYIDILEGYDHGIAVPACYLFGFADEYGNIFILDGFHQAELSVEDISEKIKNIRKRYAIESSNHILADPDIFRRKSGDKKTVGQSVSDMFYEEGIYCERGENGIAAGIAKVSSYLNVQQMHKNPITGEFAAPFMYFSEELEFLIKEISDYYWKRDSQGDVTDKPMDKNDHAMDTLKYALSRRPRLATLIMPIQQGPVGVTRWAEIEPLQEDPRAHRYG